MTALSLRLDATDEGIARCALALAAGHLVAFPTETVYGLGASALSEAAVHRIFLAKGRPLTDPLIVHVPSLEDALALVDLDDALLAAFRCLGAALWPGPLTLVARAAASVPKVVMAGGDSVGVRVPAHPLARRLLAAAGVPVAAPSANRFGHVSPTTAAHVLADLGHAGALVLDGGPCAVGIESTVARLDPSGVAVLRRGAVSPAEIGAALAGAGLALPVTVRERHVAATRGEEAPGQLLTHYAPSRPAFLFAEGAPEPAPTALHPRLPLRACVVIDFGGRARRFAGGALRYFDLAPDGDPRAAAARLFAILRVAEEVEAAAILLPDLSAGQDEAICAIQDRLFRAASGQRAHLVDACHVVCPLPQARAAEAGLDRAISMRAGVAGERVGESLGEPEVSSRTYAGL